MEVRTKLHAPAALPTGTEPPVAVRQKDGWAPEPVWRFLLPENKTLFWKLDLVPSSDGRVDRPLLT
jgi:hypothetical protein